MQVTQPPVDPAFRPNHWRLAVAQLLSGIGIATRRGGGGRGGWGPERY